MHLSEEMEDPRIEVPRAMVGAIGFNGILGFSVLLAILFGLGDMDAALASPTGYPIIEIFSWMTRQNAAATTALTSTLVFSSAIAALGLIASSSRTVWSAARDGVFPFSHHLAKLSIRHDNLPVWSITASTLIMALLGLLNIASTAAFTAIISLAVVALQISYLMPVAAILCLRLRASKEEIVWGPWKLRSWVGCAANVVSVCYTTLTIVILLLRPARPVTGANMNYAGLVLGVVLVGSTVGWLASGRHRYKGPWVNSDCVAAAG
jgi:choline transport protein